MIERALVQRAREYCEDLRASLAEAAADSQAPADGPPDRALALFARMARHRAEPPPPAVGQVWTVAPGKARGISALVALTHVDDPLLRGVVLTPELWIADEHDLLLPPAACPGGESLAACLFLDVPLVRASLGEPVGELHGEALLGLLMSLQARLTGGYARTPSGVRNAGSHRSFSRHLAWRLCAEDGRAVEIVTGSSLNEDDPRHEARALLEEATRWLPERALAAIEEQETVGSAGLVADLLARLQAAFSRKSESTVRGLVGHAGIGAAVSLKSLFGSVLSDVAGIIAVTAESGWLARGSAWEVSHPAAGEPSDANLGVVILGEVVVLIGADSADGAILLKVVAVSRTSGRPVAGVSVDVEQDGAKTSRQTDGRGVVAGVVLPLGTRFTLELRHGRDVERIDV